MHVDAVLTFENAFAEYVSVCDENNIQPLAIGEHGYTHLPSNDFGLELVCINQSVVIFYYNVIYNYKRITYVNGHVVSQHILSDMNMLADKQGIICTLHNEHGPAIITYTCTCTCTSTSTIASLEWYIKNKKTFTDTELIPEEREQLLSQPVYKQKILFQFVD